MCDNFKTGYCERCHTSTNNGSKPNRLQSIWSNRYWQKPPIASGNTTNIITVASTAMWLKLRHSLHGVPIAQCRLVLQIVRAVLTSTVMVVTCLARNEKILRKCFPTRKESCGPADNYYCWVLRSKPSNNRCVTVQGVKKIF